jgi:hypothetical protein
MKLVRVTLSSGTTQFYIDRPYEAESTDFSNCDNALKYLHNLMEKNDVLAVMLMRGGTTVVENGNNRHDPYMGSVPAMINLRNITMLVIENAGVYEVEEKEKEKE